MGSDPSDGATHWVESPHHRGLTPNMKTILVVDDEPSIAQIAGDYLRHGGVCVLTPANRADPRALAPAQRPRLNLLGLRLAPVGGAGEAARRRGPRGGARPIS